MAQITTTTCDRCGKAYTDSQRQTKVSIKVAYVDQNNIEQEDETVWEDCCFRCFAKAVKHVGQFTNRYKKKSGKADETTPTT